jgi:hypothetical protein
MRRWVDERSADTQPRVIEPDPKTWTFAERERELFDSAKGIPSWRVANQARRHLAGMLAAVTEHLTSLDAPLLIAEADAELARKVAVVNLGVIIVRSTSAIIALVGCGHERESLMHARVSLTTARESPLASYCLGDATGHSRALPSATETMMMWSSLTASLTRTR